MAERQLSEAEASFVAGRLDEVAEICGDLIAADPDCHQAFYLLGRTCMSLGKFDEAYNAKALASHDAAFLILSAPAST